MKEGSKERTRESAVKSLGFMYSKGYSSYVHLMNTKEVVGKTETVRV
jgi:hypothetical protein